MMLFLQISLQSFEAPIDGAQRRRANVTITKEDFT